MYQFRVPPQSSFQPIVRQPHACRVRKPAAWFHPTGQDESSHYIAGLDHFDFPEEEGEAGFDDVVDDGLSG
jgi:hypothetical protein